MATSEQYAAWIVKNKDLKGTPEFETVAKAYELSKQQPAESAKPAEMPNPEGERLANLPPVNKFLMGVGNAVINPALGLGQLTGLVPDQYIQERQKRFEPLEKESAAYGAGKLGGEVALSLMIPGGATLRGAALGQAALGAAQPAQNLEERGINASIGAAGAGLGYGLAKGVGRVFNPQTSEYAKTLMNEGVTLTPGQLLGNRANVFESKLESLPLIGDAIANARRKGYEEFNKAAINRAVAPVGEKVEKIGNEGIAEAGDILSRKYDELLPKITFLPDKQFVSDLQKIKSKVSQLPEQEQKAFNNILTRIESQHGPLGFMDGRAFKDVESEIGTEAKDFSSATSAYERKLGNHLKELLTAYRDVLPRANPNYKSELSNINKGWANLTRIETAGQKELKEGVFSPSQLSQASRQLDESTRNRATARGQALLQDLAQAGSILPSQYPNSGTAGRLALDALVAGTIPVTPTLAAGLSLGALPYLGRKTTQAVIAKRPESMRTIGDFLSRSAPAGARVAAPSLLDLYQQQ